MIDPADRKLKDLNMEMMNSQLIKGLFIDWNRIDERSYLRRIPALKGLDSLSFDHSITFFVGENGSGKSTLLEAIAVAYGFNPEGGTKNYSFSTYDSHSELCDALRLSRGVRRAGGGYSGCTADPAGLRRSAGEYCQLFEGGQPQICLQKRGRRTDRRLFGQRNTVRPDCGGPAG